MKKLTYSIFISVLVFACNQKETDANLLMTLDMANDQLSSANDKFVDRLEMLVLNNGSRPSDVQVLGTLKDILFSQLEDLPEMRTVFSESIEAANLGLDVEPMEAALSGMDYYSEVNNQKESQFNYLMWKINKLLVQRELIQQVSLQIGTHDLPQTQLPHHQSR